MYVAMIKNAMITPAMLKPNTYLTLWPVTACLAAVGLFSAATAPRFSDIILGVLQEDRSTLVVRVLDLTTLERSASSR